MIQRLKIVNLIIPFKKAISQAEKNFFLVLFATNQIFIIEDIKKLMILFFTLHKNMTSYILAFL